MVDLLLNGFLSYNYVFMYIIRFFHFKNEISKHLNMHTSFLKETSVLFHF